MADRQVSAIKWRSAIQGTASIELLSQFIAAVLDTSIVGIAVIDKQLRYKSLNDALASMNGYPVEAHLGEAIPALIGRAAPRVVAAIRQVLQTGEPLYNLEITAKLPTRKSVGYWLESYYPLKNKGGETREVVVLVVETTERRRLEKSVRKLIDTLVCLDQTLTSRVKLGLGDSIETCLRMARRISMLIRPRLVLGPPPLPTHSELLLSPGHIRRRSVEKASSDTGEAYALMLGRLTEREREVLKHLANGKSSKEIATEIGISVRTVESHRARLTQKLSMHSIAELVRFAVESELLFT
jgi:DNA-binding CsgD family transcriptional regulator